MTFERILKNVLVSIVTLTVFAGMLSGQAASGPTFEVATVKPSALDMTKLALQM